MEKLKLYRVKFTLYINRRSVYYDIYTSATDIESLKLNLWNKYSEKFESNEIMLGFQDIQEVNLYDILDVDYQ